MFERQSATPRRRQQQLGFGVALAFALRTTLAAAQAHTYTFDVDFDAGVLEHVNHDAVHDQLQLNQTAQSFSFLWIANSSRGTMVRIDASTGVVLGEYRTAPGSRPRNPSRTAIDEDGNVWTGNRGESQDNRGSVVEIGLVLGGTRVSKWPNGMIVPDAQGGYLAPPFLFCSALDRDHDGLIRTSRGLGDVLAWPDITDGQGGVIGLVEDATDECIRIYQRTSAPSVNQVSIDAEGNLWAGAYPAGVFDVLDGDSGGRLRTVPVGFGGFGGGFDAAGVLWSSSPNQHALLRYDPVSGVAQRIPVTQSTGIFCDPRGFVWNSMFTNNTLTKIDSQGLLVSGFPVPAFGGGSFGIVATAVDGDVWVANSNSNTVTRLGNGTALRKRLTVSASPNGLAVDAAGKLWVTSQLQNTAQRIDPHGGADGLGSIDLTVSLGSGAGPQNFGGMAGTKSARVIEPHGSWTVIHDGGRPSTGWSSISWHADEPSGSHLGIEARAGDDAALLGMHSWMQIANGEDLRARGLRGRHLQIRATFDLGSSMQSPVLRDLSVAANEPPDCSQATPSLALLWPPDHRMADIEIHGVTDSDGDSVTVVVTRIRQDEPVVGRGSGSEAPDGAGIGTAVARLRAERAGNGNGRVYEIQFSASDGKGGSCEGTVQVCVPHDRGQGAICVDDGPLFVSTATAANGSGPLEARLFPNPFNPTTTLSYALPSEGPVLLTIYDLRGREVRRLVNAVQEPGEHAVRWDGRDARGASMPSGVYVYRVHFGELQTSGRMLLVK